MTPRPVARERDQNRPQAPYRTVQPTSRIDRASRSNSNPTRTLPPVKATGLCSTPFLSVQQTMADDPTQPQSTRERLRGGDVAMFRVAGHPITTNEVHAILLGFAGVLSGLAYTAGHELVAIGFAGTLLGHAILGEPMFHSCDYEDYVDPRSEADPNPNPIEDPTMGLKTIRHEPWWFSSSFIASFLSIVHAEFSSSLASFLSIAYAGVIA